MSTTCLWQHWSGGQYSTPRQILSTLEHIQCYIHFYCVISIFVYFISLFVSFAGKLLYHKNRIRFISWVGFGHHLTNTVYFCARPSIIWHLGHLLEEKQIKKNQVQFSSPIIYIYKIVWKLTLKKSYFRLPKNDLLDWICCDAVVKNPVSLKYKLRNVYSF